MSVRPEFPIRAVSRLTGLSADTLRAWERRYEAVTPSRGDRGRLYTQREVERLKQLARLVERGHAIGTIASMPDAALGRLMAEDRPPAASTERADLETLRRAVAAYDIEAVERSISRHSLLLPPQDLILSVIVPLLRDIGARWESGTICTAHEHLVSSAVRNVLGGLLRAAARHTSQRRIVFAAPAGQRHELGLLCAAVLAAWGGHGVVYLGPDLPPADIADAVRATKAGTLVLSSTIAETSHELRLKELRQLPRHVQIIAGGTQAAALRSAVGSRAREVERLEDFPALVNAHA
jgi:DNA-binding transcriptional MerR regulator/methylmalonyl-CoA mutase cobalamin-binding subunit